MSAIERSPVLTPLAAFGLTAILAACGGGEADGTADVRSVAEQSARADAESSGIGLDTLYAASLHEGVEPAAAGEAYIEIDGERLSFTGIECKVTDRDGGQAVQFQIKAETAYGVTELSVLRGIGWDIGFEYEEELVQVTHLGGTGNRGEFSDISMAQNAGDENGGIKWYRGEGPDPMLQIVGTDVTATGTLAGVRGARNPQEGDFVMAANCG